MKRLNRNILLFGFTSLLTDVAGEMIAPVLPLFMSLTLGLDKVFIGLVEGIAESTASFAKLVSGYLSDRTRRRKPLIILGYLLAALAKPFLALSVAGGHVIGSRFADRLGKGIRTSPRDALLAESVPPEKRGFAFGFHRAMDSAGAIIGPGIAALLLAWKFGYRAIFVWAFIPAILAVIILFFVREQKEAPRVGPARPAGSMKFSVRFYLYLGACALFTLGNSSDAFITLRARNLGLGLAAIPLIWMLLNIFNTAVAMPAGYLSDRLGRRGAIVVGLLLYAAVYAGLAAATASWHIWPLMIGYGLYYGISDGAFRARVADFVPRERLGTAYGLYHTVVGAMLLPASLLMGFLWETFGHKAAFFTGSALAVTAAVLLLIIGNPAADS